MVESFEETVTAARRGDAAAFNTLFARNLPPLIAFLRMKAGDVVLQRESITDLAQSVCREVLADLDDFEYRGEDQFRSWLFLTASRKIVDRARSAKAGVRDVAREVAAPGTEGESRELIECYATFCTPSRTAGAREELQRLDAAIAKLPENQREAIAMSRVLGLPYSDVAAHMGCSESAVRGLVARGLSTLSGMLRQES